MKSFLFVLAQLMLVTIVYAFAYRAGYRDAKSKAMSVVRKFADPVTCLLDQLNESIEEAQEDEHRTSDIERSTRHRASKSAFGGSASGGSNKKKVEL
jgi:hypothetical protein